MANLLIMLVSVLGLMRGLEWVVRSSEVLKNSSDIYMKLSQIMDIDTLGWLLIIASVVLFISVFVKKEAGYVLLVIGGLSVGTCFLMYGMISVETATLLSTYYTMISIGLYGYVLASIGGIALWKTRKKKK
ncbi:MAG TPA: hypothetical protein K8V44_04545 [Staphylococcus saprophyticus]|nr:hypothetical protein [Staphylococcus saprophyticus]